MMAVLSDPKLSWYLARSSGMVAWCVVSAGMAWGLLLSSRRVRRRGGPAWQLDLHRFLGTLSLVFTAVHLAAIVADNFVHFGWTDLTVPMASDWRPGAVAWGIVATYLLAAVQITSWLLPRLPRKVWHAVHLGSFGLFAAATAHGFTAGTDAGSLAVQWGAGTLGALVGGMTIQRLRSARRARHTGIPVGTPVATPVAIPVADPVGTRVRNPVAVGGQRSPSGPDLADLGTIGSRRDGEVLSFYPPAHLR